MIYGKYLYSPLKVNRYPIQIFGWFSNFVFAFTNITMTTMIEHTQIHNPVLTITEKLNHGISFQQLSSHILAIVELIPDDYRLVKNDADSIVLQIAGFPGFIPPEEHSILTINSGEGTYAEYQLINHYASQTDIQLGKRTAEQLETFLKLLKQSISGKLETTAKLLRKPGEQTTKQGLMGIISVVFALALVFLLLLGC